MTMTQIQAQNSIADKIEAYGKANNFSQEDINIALHTAWIESKLGLYTNNPDSTASGVFHYTDGTWSDFHSSLGDKNNVDNQIRAFFNDLITYKGYFDNKAENGIPNNISFGEFVYTLHMQGRNTDNYFGDGKKTWDNTNSRFNSWLNQYNANQQLSVGDLSGMGLLDLLNMINGVNSNFNNATQAAPPPRRIDPLIIDLDGDGIETVASTNGAYFDHDGNGFAERTGWVSGDDGLLVRDINGDGVINNGRELFGDQTILQNGQTATNGFQALADLDSNSDGKIDANDAAFSQIKVWQDVDGDGYSSPDELFTLSELGIASINTGYTATSISDGLGNTQIQAGTFEKTDNTTGQIGGFLLKRDTAYTIAEEWLDVPEAISALPDLQGYGNIYDLHQAIVRDASGNLQALVEEFMAETDADVLTAAGGTISIIPSSANIRNSTFEQILFKWAGVDTINPASRGGLFDARKLAVLEKFLGQDFVGTSGANPIANAVPFLNQAYQGLFEMLYGELMMQTHLKDFFDEITYSWDETTQGIRTDLSAVAIDFQQSIAANPLEGKLALAEFVRSLSGLNSENSIAWDYESFREDMLSGADDETYFIVNYLNTNSIIGTSEADTLDGTANNSTIAGLAGNDTIRGGSGNDILDGGVGNDWLAGNYGDDKFIYGRGYGNDIIQRDNSSSNGTDTVQFGEGLTADSFDYIEKGLQEGGDLILQIKDTGETLTIKNWFTSGVYQVDKFQFSDGTILSKAEFITHVGIMGTEGNDNLVGYNGISNTISGYGGNDTIVGSSGNDYLDGGMGGDSMSGGIGNDVYFVDNTGDVITENVNEGTDTVQSSIDYTLGANLENLTLTGVSASSGTGNVLNNYIIGNSANNTLTANAGNDTLTGDAGNDSLSGGDGSDTYLFRGTDGQDTINEAAGVNGDTDTLKLTNGITTTEPVLVKQNNDLYVFIDSNDYVKIVNEFQQANYGIERLEVTDGHYITRADIQNIVDTMSAINNDSGMDVMQKYNAMMVDQQYQNILAQSWHQ